MIWPKLLRVWCSGIKKQKYPKDIGLSKPKNDEIGSRCQQLHPLSQKAPHDPKSVIQSPTLATLWPDLTTLISLNLGFALLRIEFIFVLVNPQN